MVMCCRMADGASIAENVLFGKGFLWISLLKSFRARSPKGAWRVWPREAVFMVLPVVPDCGLGFGAGGDIGRMAGRGRLRGGYDAGGS